MTITYGCSSFDNSRFDHQAGWGGEVIDLDVPTIVEKLKDPVLSVERSWIQGGISPDLKALETQQSKGLLRYCEELDRLLIEEHGQLLCHNELLTH